MAGSASDNLTASKRLKVAIILFSKSGIGLIIEVVTAVCAAV